ncbi:MAG: xylose isomerase, partial [Wenyingzhuangia sp.]
DTFARGLLVADKIIRESQYEALRTKRYTSFDSGNGKAFEEGKLTFEDFYTIAKKNGELPSISGKQELFENIINDHI